MKNFIGKVYFFVKYFIPVMCVAGIIFYLSDQPNLGSGFANPLENILRKGAHFLEYGVLTFFLWVLFYVGWKFFYKTASAIVLFLVICYAGLDEFHQTFVEGRHGSLVDVTIDFFSAFVVIQIVIIFLKRKVKRAMAVNIWLMAMGIFVLFGIVSSLVWQSYEETIKSKNQTSSHFVNPTTPRLRGIGVSRDKNVESRGNKLDDDSGAGSDLKVIQFGDIQENKQADNLSAEADLKVIQYSGGNVKEQSDYNDTGEREEVEILPKKIQHKVPFTTQSPFARWDQLHEEACEEASLIMLKYYNNAGKRPGLLPAIAEEEIQKLVKYQMEKYGDFYDTDIKTNKEIGEEYFKLNNLKIIENFTILDLKKELAEGGIILIPTAGRKLKNPNFKAPGPLYHNLVITGYDDTIDEKTGKAKNIFITNDPGTRRGENYKYNQQLLYNAIHDFPGDLNKILQGPKRAIVLEFTN